jgi:hypothetical protein
MVKTTSKPPRCINPRPWLADIAKSLDESQWLAVHAPVLADLTLREVWRRSDQCCENSLVL